MAIDTPDLAPQHNLRHEERGDRHRRSRGWEPTPRGLLYIGLFLLTAWLVVKVWLALVLIGIAVILAVGLYPLIQALVRRGLPRTLAVVLVLGLMVVVSIVAVGYLVPTLISEFREAHEQLPESARELDSLLSGIGVDVQIEDKVQQIDWQGLASGRASLVYGQQALSLLLAVIFILVMAAYLLVDGPRIGRTTLRLIPEPRHEEAREVFRSITRVVSGYFRGQLLTCTAIAVFTFTLLSILGVRHALAWAVLAFFADIVPVVGAFIAIIPPVVAALQSSPLIALIVLVAMLVYQQVEDRLLIPVVFGRAMDVHPLVVIVAVLVGSQVLGIVGVIIAVPLAAALNVVAKFALDHRRLPLTQGQ